LREAERGRAREGGFEERRLWEARGG